MRKSTKCPWCKSKMQEMGIPSRYQVNYNEHYMKCSICESRGPSYYWINGEKVYKPSKNGIPK